MSDEHSCLFRHASAEYRELAGELRKLARVCAFADRGEAYCGSRDRSI